MLSIDTLTQITVVSPSQPTGSALGCAAPWAILHLRLYRLHSLWRLSGHRFDAYFSRSKLSG